MNWTLLGVVVGVVLHLLVAVYYYGRTSARVDSHEGWLEKIDRRQDNHEKRISRVEGHLRIGKE